MVKSLLILVLSIFSSVVLAINGENLYIKFAPGTIESVDAFSVSPRTPPFDCPGRVVNDEGNSPYYYIEVGYVREYNTKDITITYSGPFNGDPRKVCYGNKPSDPNFPHNIAIYNKNNGLYYDVYFSIYGLVIVFSYNGEPHSCTINQRIGFDYNVPGRYANKLIGEDGSKLTCGDDTSFSYQITAGNNKPRGTYNPGYITIYKN